MADAMNLGDQRRFACRNFEMRTQSPCAQRILQRLHEFVYALARPRRKRDAAGKSSQICVDQFSIPKIIDLVKDDERLLAVSVELFDHRLDRFDLIVDPRM